MRQCHRAATDADGGLGGGECCPAGGVGGARAPVWNGIETR